MLAFLNKLFPRRLKPVSAALSVEAGVLEAKMLRAAAAIDRTHNDGVLPTLPLKAALLLDMYGCFRIQGGKAIEITVSTINPHVELTTLHEIGHLLDYQGMDHSVKFASVNSPLLALWRDAIKSSPPIQTLGHYLSPSISTVNEVLANGSVVKYPVDKPYVEYLLKAEELWARSYSQFVAAKSGDPEILLQLNKERERPAGGINYEQYWTDPDFQPIMAEIESVFRRLGWI